MTDLHTHLLCGIDDGAPDMKTSIDMLKIMSAQGVRTVVATPHFNYSNVPPEEFIRKRDLIAQKLKPEAEKLGIKLLCASELVLGPQLLMLDDIKGLCIEGTRNVLLEMPFTKDWDSSVYDNLTNLIDYFNVTPIIAHVERYNPVIRNVKNAIKLIELGAYLQLDASSLFENVYKKTAKKLVKEELIAVVASDAHNTTARPPEALTQAYEEIEQLLSKEAVMQIKENADNMVK